MSVFVKFISLLYLKYFFIVFFALELFFVGIDLLRSLDSLPASANLVVLYLAFSASIGVGFILPLSVVLAFIICALGLIRSGELVAFYALGISKNAFIKPIFLLGILISFCFVVFQSTPLAYAKDYQNLLGRLESKNEMGNLSTIFVKYQNKFIYFLGFDRTKHTALLGHIFELDGSKLISKLDGFNITFKNGKWYSQNTTKTTLPAKIEFGKSGYKVENIGEYEILEGFEPEILSNLNRAATSYSIPHAIATIAQVKDESINLALIKSSLYLSVFFPFFAPFMVVILYYYLPVMARFSGLALLSFGFVVATLCAWGVIYALSRLANSGTLSPELGIIAPVLCFGAFALYKYKKEKSLIQV